MQWHFRDAEERDIDDCAQIHVDCIHTTLSAYYSQIQLQQYLAALDYQFYVQMLKTGHFVVAEEKDSNSIIAFAYMEKATICSFSTDVDFEIQKFYVSPNKSRKGVGKALYRELERRVVEQGAHSIGVKSSSYAISFYETCGFRLTGVEDPLETEGVKCGQLMRKNMAKIIK